MGVTEGDKYQTAGAGGVQFHGSSGSHETSNAAHFSTANKQAVNQVSTGNYATSNQAGQGVKSGVTFQSAGVGGVQFHGSSGSQESANAAQFSSNNQAVSQVTNTQTTNVNSKVSTSSSANQQQLVQGVMTALIPSVEAAVQAALLQMKQSSVSSSAFQAGQQTSGSTQVTGVTTVTETTISAAEENALIARIIKVLTPSITTSVRKALALRVQSVSSNQAVKHWCHSAV